MTAAEKQFHLLRFRRFQQSREKLFAPKINAALRKQYLTFTAHVQAIGLHNALNKINSSGIATVIKSIYIDAATIYGAKIRADFVKMGAYKSIPLGASLPDLKSKKGIKFKSLGEFTQTKSRGAIGFSQHMQDLITQYFNTDILNLSEGITQTTRELITKVFTEASRIGISIDEIVKKLENTELSRVRARLIARTETVTAANQTGLIVAKETGLLLNKTWLATKDKRTRDDHRDIDGHQVGRDEYFNVGGYDMLVPGDRGGHDGKLPVDPKEFCNCRCCTTFQPVRDSAGRLVRV